MNIKRRPVKIQMDTVIRDDDTMDRITNSFKGTVTNNGHFTVITYREELEENHYVDTLMTITDKKVNVKRSGAVSMNQSFIEQAKTECLYVHPHGKMHMETFTIDSSHTTNDLGGKVILTYEVKLNGKDSRQHELELIYELEE